MIIVSAGQEVMHLSLLSKSFSIRTNFHQKPVGTLLFNWENGESIVKRIWAPPKSEHFLSGYTQLLPALPTKAAHNQYKNIRKKKFQRTANPPFQ